MHVDRAALSSPTLTTFAEFAGLKGRGTRTGQTLPRTQRVFARAPPVHPRAGTEDLTPKKKLPAAPEPPEVVDDPLVLAVDGL